MAETGRQGRSEANPLLSRIHQGRQPDPRESNTLPNPRLNQITNPKPENFSSRLTKLNKDNNIPRNDEPNINGEEAMTKEAKKEETKFVDSYGVSNVQIHSSISQSSKDMNGTEQIKKHKDSNPLGKGASKKTTHNKKKTGNKHIGDRPKNPLNT